MPKSPSSYASLPAFALLLACGSGGHGVGAGASTGGAAGSSGAAANGATSGGGTGGLTASGGFSTSGGTKSGGQSSTGGLPSSGGQSTTGGQSSTGGTRATGGAGEQASTGGMLTSGGAGAAGRLSNGGAAGANGGRGSGGASAGGPPSGGAAGASGTAGSGGATTGARCPDSTWKLTWGDDFDGPSGTAADGSKWTYDTGPNWYNGELEDYTSGTTNAWLDGNGNLVIEARQEAREGRQYTSARLKTEGKQTFTYGRFEGRIKLPYGQGMWPAFWLLGGNSWPTTGEIDIMENLGREPSIVHGTMHGPGYSGSAGPTAAYTLPGGAKFSDDYHIFAIEWETNAIRWYVDDTLYSTKTPADINGNTWVFDHGFFFILNLAVGGDWPGDPDATTVFPQHMLIDYVHVCQK